MRVRWAFMVLEDHPYGREMLSQLLAAGFVPALCVEERSEVATIEREKFLERMTGFSVAPSIDELLRPHPTPRRFVASHNDAECEATLREAAPELIVLGGTRILEPRIFEHAKGGTLNAHPGLLPEIRGSASVAWAIELDIPVGCTCHFIEAGIDTGPIVSKEHIEVRRGDTYEKLCHATAVLSARLMVGALREYAAGTLRGVTQLGGAKALRNMPPQRVEAMKRKLAEGRYAHYAPYAPHAGGEGDS